MVIKASDLVVRGNPGRSSEILRKYGISRFNSQTGTEHKLSLSIGDPEYGIMKFRKAGNFFQNMAAFWIRKLFFEQITGSNTADVLIQGGTLCTFEVFFHHIGAAKCDEEKTENSDADIERQKPAGKMMLFHGFLTSNL